MDDTLQKFDDEHRDEPPALAGTEGTAANASTRIDYTLRFTGWPTIPQVVIIAVATAVYTVLSWLAIIGLPSPFLGVSSIFLAIGFGIPFAIWFGGWAVVIGYLGNFLGAGLFIGTPLIIALPFGTTDIIQLGLPMLLYRLLARRFGVNPIGKDVYTLRGFLFFLLCAVIPNNIIGGAYGNGILLLFNQPIGSYLPAWFLWSSTNMIVTIVIGSLLLGTVGPVVERYGLTVRNLFS